jgi:hypothetical protein
MHWPAPIKVVFAGRGKILNAGFALFAALVAVLAQGWLGAGIFTGAVLALLVIELWAESGRLTGERDDSIAERDAARQHGSAIGAQLTEAREESSRAQRGAAEAEVLRLQVRRLQQALASPQAQLRQVLEMMASHARLIELVQKHRVAAAEQPEGWPVLKVTLETEMTVSIVAYAGTASQTAEGEPIALVETSSGEQWLEGEASSHGDEVSITTDLDQLPASIVNELESQGVCRPEGYVLKLAGLVIPAYHDLADSELERLDEALRVATRTVAAAFEPVKQLDSEPEKGPTR